MGSIAFIELNMDKDQLSIHFLDSFFVRFTLQPYTLPRKMNDVLPFFQSDFGKAALMLSSEVLSEKLSTAEPLAAPADKKLEKQNLAFTKYYLRAHSRPTPFGLFAGMDRVTWQDHTRLVFETNQTKNVQTYSCLDIDLMHFFLAQIKTFPEVRKALTFTPNSTLYRVGNQFRYTEKIMTESGKRYELSAFEFDDFYTSFFDFCKTGKKIDEMASFVSDQVEIDLDEAFEFIEQISSSGVLVDNFELGISGDSLLHQFENQIHFVRQLVQVNSLENNELKVLLETALTCIDKIKLFDQADHERTQILAEIQDLMRTKFPGFNAANVIQVNTHPELTTNALSYEIQKKLKKSLLVLAKLADKPRQKTLDKFKEEFYTKYGEKRIPLLKALDPENGIVYGNLSAEQMDKNPFLSGLSFRSFDGSGSGIDLTNSEYFMLGKLNEAIRNNSSEIRISAEDLAKSKAKSSLFLPTIPVSFSVYDNGKEPLIHLHCVGQSCAINMLARFHEQDETISQVLNEVNDIEKSYYTDQIVAEIVHLPEARMGNVVHRPLFRDYDIPYIGKSSQPQDRQINIDDLDVCVEDDIIRLYSRSLKKYVIPRLSNAHNYDMRTTQVYQFMCHLQFQRKRDGIYFSWGNLEHLFDHFPRVIVEGIVVAPEKWCIHFDQIKEILQTDDLKNYFQAHKLPLRFLMLDGDNYLPIDLENELSCTLLISELKSKKRLDIEEQFNYDHSVLKTQNGQGIPHEFVSIVHQKTSVKTNEMRYPDNSAYSIQTKFGIGSEWLYLKIYTGLKSAELILVNALIPLLAKCREADWIKKWFFIKYNDPENHLRIRFLMQSTDKLPYLLMELNTLLKTQNLDEICTLEMAEYQRETERYDPLLMEQTEDLFCTGSNLALTLLQSDAEREIERWKWAAAWCDFLMEKFNLSIKNKQEITTRLGQSFLDEHGFSTSQRKKIDQKFRVIEPQLFDILMGHSEERNTIAAQYAQFDAFDQINAAFELQKVQVDKWDYVASLMHMELNRLFRSNQRKNEMVVYYCLGKMYRSLIARGLNTQTNPG